MVPPPFPTTTDLLAVLCLVTGIGLGELAKRYGGGKSGYGLATGMLALGICLFLWP